MATGIPNQLLFISFAPMQFSFVNYLCLKSAVVVNRPSSVVLYCDTLPEGEWWDRSRPLVTDIVRLRAPSNIGGVPIDHPAHKSDLLRLRELYEHGGIYLDLDVLCVRPFTDLLQNKFVIGQEGRETIEGLCNGVILSEPATKFCQEWLNGFDPATSHWSGFRARGHDQYWNEISCRYPAYLASQMPDEVKIAPFDAFHWPTWTDAHLRWLFEVDGDTFPNAYCHHLWQSLSWDRYLKYLSPTSIRSENTNFNSLARPFLTDL